MNAKRFFGIIAVLAVASLLFSGPALAKKRAASGSYTGKHGGAGTFQKETSREPGKKTGATKWQNERGEGSRQSERTWNKETGSGTYSSSTTNAAGKTWERSGALTKTGENTVAASGTFTGPQGKVVDVNKTITKTGDGSRTVESTYTGPEGNTVSADKTVQRTGDGRTVTGQYSTSGGKSGTFASGVTGDGSGGWDRHSEVTNQDGETLAQDVDVTKDGNTYTRTVTNTTPSGESKTGTGTLTVENVSSSK